MLSLSIPLTAIEDIWLVAKVNKSVFEKNDQHKVEKLESTQPVKLTAKKEKLKIWIKQWYVT